MTTAADLDRLQALLARLTPVAGRQRGEVIRADDWNLVVGSLIEVARAVLAEAAAADVPPHQHTDQVQLSWLDGRLRTLLQSGPLNDPATLTRLAAVERRLAGSGGNLDGVKADLDNLRSRVTEITTRDLVREKDVTLVRRNLAAVGDSRGDIVNLRQTLDAVRTDLTRAIEVGRQLEQDGHPIDVPALVARVDALDVLREHLTGPDGEPFDAAVLERRLTELTNTLVTEEELDEALRQIHPSVDEADLAAIKSDVLTSALNEVNPKLDGLRQDVSTDIDNRLSDLDGRIGEAVTGQLPQVRDQILSQTRQAIDAAIDEEDARVGTTLDQRLAAEHTALTGELGARIDTVDGRILPTAQAEAARQFDEKLPPLNAAIGALSERTAGLETQTANLAAHDGTQDAAIGNLQTGQTALSARIDREVPAAVTTADQHAAKLVDAAADRLKQELSDLCTAEVAARVDDALGTLRQEMREIARDEATVRVDERFKALPDDILRIFKADFDKRGPLWQLITSAKPGIRATEPAAGAPAPAAPATGRKRTTRKKTTGGTG